MCAVFIDKNMQRGLKMQLSRAIKKGCAISYGLSGAFLISQIDGKPCASALGAAFLGIACVTKRIRVLRLALYHETRDEGVKLADSQLNQVFGKALDKKRIPIETKHGGTEMTPLRNAIIYLNDNAGWTREDIANYLESFGF